MKREDIFQLIDDEREHQILKWGNDEETNIPGFLLIMQKELQEAIDGWIKNIAGKHSALNEIVQVVAVGTACLEKYHTVVNSSPINEGEKI